MRLFSMFGIGGKKILEKNCCVKGTVTMVQDSYLYVVKKPVRIGMTAQNTKLSHFITFTYTVAGIPYSGRLFVTPYYRCPHKGEQIDVYYDPEKPENYACAPFGPAVNPIGW